MTNPVKRKLPDLLSQAAGLAQGAEDFGAILDLGPNTAPNIRLDITGLNSSIAAHGLGKDELRNRRLIVEGLEAECRLFMVGTRDSMKPTLGYVHSSAWDTVGLIGSFEIPARKTRLLPMLSAFQAYLTSHPALEDADKGITAIKAGELYDELDEAIGAVNSQALDPLDMRWESFGLNRPGIKARPNQPTGLTATVIGPNTVSTKWNRTPRAEYYRVRRRVVGVDTEFVFAGNSADLNFLFEGLPANSAVEIMISAVNNGGESLLSEVVTVAIP